MRVFGVMLQRVGRVIAVGAFLGGLALAVYALGDGLHRLAEGELSGEKEALKRLVLYPAGAAMVGSLAAVVGLVLMYLGESTRNSSSQSSLT